MVATYSITSRNDPAGPQRNENGNGDSILKSDLTIDNSKLLPSSISIETADLNRKLQALEQEGDKWYHVGAAKYRALRKNGLTPLPGAVLLSSATSFSIPSRDNGRGIPCRILQPQNQNNCIRGIFLHFHGGGWVLNDEESSDPYLQRIADFCQLICISVGYRLAPEYPFPAGPDDCFDAARWLIDHGLNTFQHKLSFVGGESAGANLALVTALALLRSPIEKYANFHLDGLMLHYGTFSLHWHPGTRNFQRRPTLVLDQESLGHFRDAYLPGSDPALDISPHISPFYADLSGLELPRILVTCGTEDCLLEDSLFLSVRWMLAGGSAILKLYPGSPHGYILFPPEIHTNSQIALQDVGKFVAEGY